MSKIPSTIFNDVIGPVMMGPSSSHTAGPARIGKLVGQLLEGRIKKATFTFARDGSFAGTYQGQKSDQGLVAGLLGWKPDDVRLPEAISEAEKLGIDINFIVEYFSAEHPNTVQIMLEDQTATSVTATGISLGGGTVSLCEINGFPVEIKGDYWEHLFFIPTVNAKAGDQILKFYRDQSVNYESVATYWQENCGLIVISSREELNSGIVSKILVAKTCSHIRQLEPVMPILASNKMTVPFTTAAQLREFCAEKGMTLWEAGRYYEAIRGNVSEEKIHHMMSDVVDIMKESIDTGRKGRFQMRGFLKPSATEIEKGRRSDNFLPTGILDKATVDAIAVMELNSSMGRIVAAPTAGSCGVIPAVIFNTADELNADNDVVIRAMLCAGIVGVFIAEQATFAAEVCGCQAECGSAACMAAAALTWMKGGSLVQSLNAASLALQNMLGLICDPVAGQVEIPCISRNVSAAANAITSANMVLNGFNATIPLDEVIQAMFKVGNQLPAELRCTGKGGLCTTKTGFKLQNQLYA